MLLPVCIETVTNAVFSVCCRSRAVPNFAATVSVGEKEICAAAASRICMRRPDRSRELPFLDMLRRPRVDRWPEQT